MVIAAFVTLAATLSLTACGGGFNYPITSQSYTLTITGTGGTDIHTATDLSPVLHRGVRCRLGRSSDEVAFVR